MQETTVQQKTSFSPLANQPWSKHKGYSVNFSVRQGGEPLSLILLDLKRLGKLTKSLAVRLCRKKPLDLFKKVDYIVSMNEEQKKLKQMREEAKEQRAQVAKLVKVIHKGIDQSQFQVPQGPVNHNGQYTW